MDKKIYLQSPFENDPFSLVWKAFQNLYPDKECEVWYDQHQGDNHRKEYGYTNFPNDGSISQILIFAEHNINIQTETLAHELAHVAVGVEHEHDEEWEKAFQDIFDEYERIGNELFSKEVQG